MDPQEASSNDKNGADEAVFNGLKNESIQISNDQIKLNPNNSKNYNFNLSISNDSKQNDEQNSIQLDSNSISPQLAPTASELYQTPFSDSNQNKETHKQAEFDKLIQNKSNQIKIDLMDLGFTENDVHIALHKTDFCAELAFDILYEKEKDNINSNNKPEINFSDIYHNYDENNQKFIDFLRTKYKVSLDDAVEAFETCERNTSSTEQLIELLIL